MTKKVTVLTSITMMAVLFAFSGIDQSQAETDLLPIVDPIEWTNAVNVAVDGNDLTKNGETKKWDAGAVSSKTISSGNVYVEATLDETDTWRMFGFSSKDDSQHRDDIEFAMYMYGKNNELRAWHNGDTIQILGEYRAGDTVRLEINDSDISWNRNGESLFILEDAITEFNYPLFVDTSFASPDATLNDVKIGIIPEELDKEIQMQLDDLLVLIQQVSDKLTALEQKVKEQQILDDLLVPIQQVSDKLTALEQKVKEQQTKMDTLRCENIVPFADLHECDFSGQDLSDIDLTGANLSAAILIGANLSNAQLQGADFSGADFYITNMPEANLTGANLTGANFYNESMQQTDLQHAILKGAILIDADLTNTKLGVANLTGANLTGADLTRADLNFAHLDDADLSGANFTKASVYKIDLEGADIKDVILDCNDIRHAAPLMNCDFSNTNLTRAPLKGANLYNANFYIEDQPDVGVKRAQLAHANLRDAILTHANLRNAELSSAFLESANLEDANLSNARMWHTQLDGTLFFGANVSGTDFKDSTVDNSFGIPYTHGKCRNYHVCE